VKIFYIISLALFQLHLFILVFFFKAKDNPAARQAANRQKFQTSTLLNTSLASHSSFQQWRGSFSMAPPAKGRVKRTIYLIYAPIANFQPYKRMIKGISKCCIKRSQLINTTYVVIRLNYPVI